MKTTVPLFCKSRHPTLHLRCRRLPGHPWPHSYVRRGEIEQEVIWPKDRRRFSRSKAKSYELLSRSQFCGYVFESSLTSTFSAPPRGGSR